MPNEQKVQVSLRLPANLIGSFDRIAKVLDRDRSWVMQRALSHYLENEGAELLQEADGLEELERGEAIDLNSTLERAEAVVSAAELSRTAGVE